MNLFGAPGCAECERLWRERAEKAAEYVALFRRSRRRIHLGKEPQELELSRLQRNLARKALADHEKTQHGTICISKGARKGKSKFPTRQSSSRKLVPVREFDK